MERTHQQNRNILRQHDHFERCCHEENYDEVTQFMSVRQLYLCYSSMCYFYGTFAGFEV